MKISNKQLFSLIREAVTPVDDATLNGMTDEQLESLIAQCKKTISDRKLAAERSGVATVKGAIDYIEGAASGDLRWSDNKFYGALDTLTSKGRVKSDTIKSIDDLAGSLSNTAYSLEAGEFDSDREALRAEKQHERGMIRLRAMLAKIKQS